MTRVRGQKMKKCHGQGFPSSLLACENTMNLKKGPPRTPVLNLQVLLSLDLQNLQENLSVAYNTTHLRILVIATETGKDTLPSLLSNISYFTAVVLGRQRRRNPLSSACLCISLTSVQTSLLQTEKPKSTHV